MRKWVVKQQAYLGQVLEDRLPVVTHWAEMQGQRLIAAYNLSQVSPMERRGPMTAIVQWKCYLHEPAPVISVARQRVAWDRKYKKRELRKEQACSIVAHMRQLQQK